MTAYQLHIRRWKKCNRCILCAHRKQVVFVRGSLPAEVLFVGEAPGKSENNEGLPFWGPAGKELDRLINRAGYDLTDHDMLPVRRCFTNLVGCMPKDDQGDKLSDPPEKAILACAPKLREIAELCQPKLIVCVGKLSEKWTRKLLEFEHEGVRDGTRSKNKGVARPHQHGTRGKDVGGDSDTSLFAVKPAYVAIVHPAHILRADVSQKSLARQRVVVTLADALDRLREKEQRKGVRNIS